MFFCGDLEDDQHRQRWTQWCTSHEFRIGRHAIRPFVYAGSSSYDWVCTEDPSEMMTNFVSAYSAGANTEENWTR